MAIMDTVMALSGSTLKKLNPSSKTLAIEATVATWDACVLGLIRATPDPRIRNLADLLWLLCSSRTVSTAMVEGVQSLSFMGLVRGDGKKAGVVVVPNDWIQRFAKDPWMQLGGVVFSASKARDFWNERLMSEQALAEDRAAAFEAIFLRAATDDRSKTRSFSPNDYQRGIMEKFQDFPERVGYEDEPFDLSRANRLFEDFSKRGIQAPVPHRAVS